MNITPATLEQEFSLPTAATRLDFLSRRDNPDANLAAVLDADDSWSSLTAATTSLDAHEALELLALGEVIERKAHDSRLIGLRAARRGGADWGLIAAAMDRTPVEVWELFMTLVDESLEGEAAAAARELAGARPAR